jgi:hypothetical protein
MSDPHPQTLPAEPLAVPSTTYILLSTGETIVVQSSRDEIVQQYRGGGRFFRVTQNGNPVTLMVDHIVALSDTTLAYV